MRMNATGGPILLNDLVPFGNCPAGDPSGIAGKCGFASCFCCKFTNPHRNAYASTDYRCRRQSQVLKNYEPLWLYFGDALPTLGKDRICAALRPKPPVSACSRPAAAAWMEHDTSQARTHRQARDIVRLPRRGLQYRKNPVVQARIHPSHRV